MKDLNYFKMSIILFISLFLFSCSTEDANINTDESEKAVVSKSGEASLQDVLGKLKALANFEGKRVSFDLEYSQDGTYSSSNIRLIENDFAGDFEVAFFNENDEQLSPGTISFKCKNGGETSTITIYKNDSIQDSYIVLATLNCLNKTSCDTVRKVSGIVAPE